MSDDHRPRRPAMMSPAAMEAFGGTVDPMQEIEAAHQTAAVLVHAGRSAHDPTVTARLVDLVEELGLSTVADLWAHRPARTLPGALWRLYVLREWVRRAPDEASLDYRAGVRFADVDHAVAGAADPPGPRRSPTWPTPSSPASSRATWPSPWSGPLRSAASWPRDGRTGPRGRRRPPAPPTSWTPLTTSRPPPRSGASEKLS